MDSKFFDDIVDEITQSALESATKEMKEAQERDTVSEFYQGSNLKRRGDGTWEITQDKENKPKPQPTRPRSNMLSQWGRTTPPTPVNKEPTQPKRSKNHYPGFEDKQPPKQTRIKDTFSEVFEKELRNRRGQA